MTSMTDVDMINDDAIMPWLNLITNTSVNIDKEEMNDREASTPGITRTEHVLTALGGLAEAEVIRHSWHWIQLAGMTAQRNSYCTDVTDHGPGEFLSHLINPPGINP